MSCALVTRSPSLVIILDNLPILLCRTYFASYCVWHISGHTNNVLCGCAVMTDFIKCKLHHVFLKLFWFFFFFFWMGFAPSPCLRVLFIYFCFFFLTWHIVYTFGKKSVVTVYTSCFVFWILHAATLFVLKVSLVILNQYIQVQLSFTTELYWWKEITYIYFSRPSPQI